MYSNSSILVLNFIIICVQVPIPEAVKLDEIDCGVDEALHVSEGDVELTTYPWLGILYYYYDGDVGESRALTSVALIHVEFVIGPAADIGPMPKHDFRKNTRVLLGEGWERPGRRVRSYVIHPQYGETYNTIAIVQLKDRVRRDSHIKPLCPPPDILRNPEFYVVKHKEDYEMLQKEVIPMTYVPGKMCKDFYVSANLYAKKMRPPYVVCTVSLETEKVCVWEAGGVLVARDVWGRWQLLGILVRGPGCGAPSRYLDMLGYYPWVRESLDKYQRFTISKINNQKYVLRSGMSAYQRFGACDPEEKINLVYRESVVIRTDNNQYQFLNYNLTIRQNVELTCLTLELVNASASSEMSVHHYCPREVYGPPCYYYKASMFHINVYLIFSDKCTFEMFIWGYPKDMTLVDIMEWKWEEGTYYEDFHMLREEYRGQTFMTTFGYEPLEHRMWVPDYDIWTTTEFDNASWSSTTPPPDREGVEGTDPPPPPVTERRTRKTVSRKRTRAGQPRPRPRPKISPSDKGKIISNILRPIDSGGGRPNALPPRPPGK